MRTEVLKALIQNSTILVVAFLFVTRFSRWNLLGSKLKSYLLQGAAYALCGILAIAFSVEVSPGVLIDMRTPIVVIAALTGGPIVGAITILPMLAFRILLGGTGMTAGIGIILSALFLGLLLRRFDHSERPAGLLFQFITGIGSASVYYLWILTLPEDISTTVLRNTFLPLTAASVLSTLAIFLIRRREHAHQCLLKSLSEINDLFEEISLDDNIGITVICNYRIMHINRSLIRKFGFNRFDPLNDRLSEIIAPKCMPKIKDFLDRADLGHKIDAMPMEIAVRGGGAGHFLVHARKLLYKGRESILVVSVDISKLVTMEQTLANRMDQLQLSLFSFGAVLWKADLSSDLLEASPDFYEMLNYHPAEEPPLFSHWLLGTHMTDEFRKTFSLLQEGALETVKGELSLKGDDGKTRWFNIGVRVTQVDGHGSPVELTGILHETTAIKEKELDLISKEIEDIQSQKMETIGRLAGGVAHDFNNLLHIIMGYTEILKKVSENDVVTENLAGHILEAAKKGSELVRQLLLFSRDKTPQLKQLSLQEVTGSFLKLLRRIVEENIVISSDIPMDLPPVMGDAGQLEQVLMNLCINSRDAMPDGGSIMVSLFEYLVEKPETIITGVLQNGRYVCLSVQDTGTGIPPEKHRSIFEPFYTTKPVDKGTGLGLATVLGIVESHGGLIDVTNIPEGGLKIRVFLPVSTLEEMDTAMDIPPEKEADPVSLTVLVAEDDPQVMNLTVEGLGASGIKVIRASNGRQALETYKVFKDGIDLLIFDVVMPEMSGTDALKEIRKLNTAVPVIFTTGYAGDRLSGLKGSFNLISKPYAIADLLRMIRMVINRSGDNE